MAQSANVIWEVQTGGSDSNGGGFDPSTTLTADLTATTANTSGPVVSSASYTFVAGDVGAWLFIQSGTNWLPGWYKIASVSSGAATLQASIGAAVPYVGGSPSQIANTVSGCASVASPTSGVWTIDYSQRSTANALTSLTTSGAVSVVSTTSATKAMIGNSIRITGGTNFTTGVYTITAATAGTSITLDRTCSTAAAASGTANVGGAFVTLGQLEIVAAVGQMAYVKSGTYSITSAITLATLSTYYSGFTVQGYQTTRGDNTGTRPILTTSTNSIALYVGGGNQHKRMWRNIKFTSTAATKGFGYDAALGNSGNVSYDNCVFDGFASAIRADDVTNYAGSVGLESCVVTNCTTLAAVRICGGSITNCQIFNNSCDAVSTGDFGFGVLNISDNIIYNNTGSGFRLLATGSNVEVFISNNAFYSNTIHGINFTACDTCGVIENNIFENNTTSGISCGISSNRCCTMRYNSFYNNGTNYGTGTSPGIGDNVLGSSAFNNASGGDFSLGTGGASLKNAGWPQTVGTTSTNFNRSIGPCETVSGGGTSYVPIERPVRRTTKTTVIKTRKDVPFQITLIQPVPIERPARRTNRTTIIKTRKDVPVQVTTVKPIPIERPRRLIQKFVVKNTKQIVLVMATGQPIVIINSPRRIM
ncbi:MAG: right-handed parallel beta-helix repeat-containing protein [Schlesneria sp.]